MATIFRLVVDVVFRTPYVTVMLTFDLVYSGMNFSLINQRIGILFCCPLQHGGVLVTTVALCVSFLGGEGLSAQSLHVLPTSVWVSSGCSSKIQNMHHRLIVQSVSPTKNTDEDLVLVV